MTGDKQATVAQLRAFARTLQSERATAHGQRRLEIDRGLVSVALGLGALGASVDDDGDEAQRSEQKRKLIDELMLSANELVEQGAELAAAIEAGGEDVAEAAAKLRQVVRDLDFVHSAVKVFMDPAIGAVSH